MVLMKVHRWFYQDPTTGEWRLTPQTLSETEARGAYPETRIVPGTAETRIVGEEPFCAEMPLRAAA